MSHPNHKSRPGLLGGSLPKNNLQNLFLILKGSSRSGNFGHSGRKGKKGGSSPNLMFSYSIENEEIKQILKEPHRKVSVKITKDLADRYTRQYDFWKSQGSTDAKLLERIESADKLPPIIVAGNKDRWHVTDGSHRLAVAIKRGLKTIPAYMLER